MKKRMVSPHRSISWLGPLCVLLTCISAFAIVVNDFSGWDKLSNESPEVFVARCTKTPGMVANYGLRIAPIEIVYALKGATNHGPATLASLYWPRQGENYMIFANRRQGTDYEAIESYRVVPIGAGPPPTYLLDGKPYDEQVKILLKYRLKLLNLELQQMKEEKDRLERFVGDD